MIQITHNLIDPARLLAAVEDGASGGTVLFLGCVRDHSNGQQVVALEYEAYEPMALRQMEHIKAEVCQRWPVRGLALVHRLGYMKVGEISVAIAVSCAHRAEAFEACRFAIDTLKHTVPIWKKEYRPDGSHWVEGCAAHPIATNTETHERKEEVSV
ncbi:molybdenum cofactor biosynthesis protein MoaE [candidate division KSB1 bacterium]|nr:molybdenum cofactor biosynthesis protein MoaE [candidate division KSB1 bacterium]